MAITAQQAIDYIVPIIGSFIYGIIGLAACFGLWYYLFIVKRRKFWIADIYEQKSDSKLYLVQKDRLLEKKINFGKQTIYIFKKTKTESVPPSFECVERLGNKEYVSYVRVLGEYIPLQKQARNMPDFNNKEIKAEISHIVNKKLRDIRKTQTRWNDTSSIQRRYIYIPIHKALKYDVDYKPISYDVNMMRINEIDSLDKMFAEKKDFWQKYGSMIIIGAGIVMVIVIAWFGFEYAQKVVQASLGAADKVADPLNQLVNKISGSPPTA